MLAHPPHDPATESGRGVAVPRFALGGGVLLAVTGVVAVVLGGLVAAVSGPVEWQRGPWVAAFLVLVTGVSQTALGTSRSVLGATSLSNGAVARRAVLWNGGSAGVLLGTVWGAPIVVTAGGVVLSAGIACFARDLWSSPRLRIWWAYLSLVAVLACSIPVGVVLSWGRT